MQHQTTPQGLPLINSARQSSLIKCTACSVEKLSKVSLWLYLDGSVQGSAGKLVVVFGVDDDLHDIVGVTFKHLTAGPLFLPVPQLDQHVI